MAKSTDIIARDNFLTDREYIIGQEIYAYDMSAAGLSIIKEHKLLSDDEIVELSKLQKEELNTAIGNIIRKRKKDPIAKLHTHFAAIRKTFCEMNEIEPKHIHAIKKDAIFTYVPAMELSVSDNIKFKVEGEYSSYLRLNNKEIYYTFHNDSLVFKGVGKSWKLHEDHMLEIFRRVLAQLEASPNVPRIAKFINDIAISYKRLDLDVGFYRELTSDSFYVFKTGKSRDGTLTDLDRIRMGVPDAENSDKSKLDISYNYVNYILPLMRILV